MRVENPWAVKAGVLGNSMQEPPDVGTGGRKQQYDFANPWHIVSPYTMMALKADSKSLKLHSRSAYFEIVTVNYTFGRRLMQSARKLPLGYTGIKNISTTKQIKNRSKSRRKV